jgi:elongation factor Ts
MAVSAQDVKALRDRTGVAMMACKKALDEANGDMDAAIEILRKRGEAKAADKADRATGEGRVAIAGRAMVKLLCETDFVGKNDDFIALATELAEKADAEGAEAAKAHFEAVKADKILKIGENIVLDDVQMVEGGDTTGAYVHTTGKVATLVVLEGGTEEQAKDVAMHATAMSPLVANPEDVPAELIEKEREIGREQMANEGKPAEIIEKIVDGKIKKFCAERALSSQPFVKDPSMSVSQYLGDAKLVKFVRMAI